MNKKYLYLMLLTFVASAYSAGGELQDSIQRLREAVANEKGKLQDLQDSIQRLREAGANEKGPKLVRLKEIRDGDDFLPESDEEHVQRRIKLVYESNDRNEKKLFAARFLSYWAKHRIKYPSNWVKLMGINPDDMIDVILWGQFMTNYDVMMKKINNKSV